MKGERAAQLELILRSHPEGLRKSEIARRMGVHRSTIGRYIGELKEYSHISEENGLVRIETNEGDVYLSLSVYESLALNMGAEMLLSNENFRNPHLVTGLRKIAMNMQTYAPKAAENILAIADEAETRINNMPQTEKNTHVMEVLIDAWESGRMVKIIYCFDGEEQEAELAPYFIGFADNENGRNPITVTGRLRHSTDISTIDISSIMNVVILEETYTIPDNLRAFHRQDRPSVVSSVVDTIHLELAVWEKSALNSFRTLAHSEIQTRKRDDGVLICSFDAENSIELILRIIQCREAVEIVSPQKFREHFTSMLEKILSRYEK